MIYNNFIYVCFNFIMLLRKKAEGLTEKKAIHILLDCSNTLRMNKGEENC